MHYMKAKFLLSILKMMVNQHIKGFEVSNSKAFENIPNISSISVQKLCI